MAGTRTGTTAGRGIRAVERTTARSEIVRTLQAAVISGELRPGVLYSAPTLALRFGVSATPVREAMLDLVKEGLVETVPNKGFRVCELSDRELDEITAVRALLEVPAVRSVAASGATGPQLRRLRKLAESIQAAADRGDVLAQNKHDLEFHRALLALAGNDTLVELVIGLRVRSRLYGQLALARTGGLTDSAAEHSALVDAVEARDADAAEALMTRHLGHIRAEWR